jgi:hypothetical protein
MPCRLDAQMTPRENLIVQVAGHLYADQMMDAARLVADFSGFARSQVEDSERALEACNSLLYWSLNNDRYDLAASMLWSENMFTFKPRCTQMVWEEIKLYNSIMLQGAASMSKSYGAGVWLLLDWVRDPEYTSVNLVGPSEDHLKDNLFTHLVTLHSQSTLPLPGIIGDLFIGLDPKKRKGAIRGVVIPIGKRPSGRLQGRKRVPRSTPHPKLGKLSRIRFFLDEVEKIPIGVWKDVDNVFSNLDEDVDGFKLLCAFNPEDPTGQVAQRCEPVGGWAAFDPEKDERWTSKRGWRVLRLDAAKCENVIKGEVIFPGLQTKTGFDRIITNSGGRDTPGYWTMARACFPRGGAVYSVISELLVERSRRTFMFAEEPIVVAGGDLALEGKDEAELVIGRFGKCIGYRRPPSHEFPKGQEVLFKDADRKPRLRWGLQVDKFITLQRGDTVKMARQIRAECLKNKVNPNSLMLDRTGNGAGVHDLLKSLWSELIMGVNYTQGASERKIIEEDTMTAKEEYERAVSELWFAAKKWFEFNFMSLGPEAYSDDLLNQLVGRRYMTGKLSKVESKDDYKSRGNSSPNKADALTLLLHGVRLGYGIVPSALDHAQTSTDAVIGFGPVDKGPVPVYVSEENKFVDIEDDNDNDWVG